MRKTILLFFFLGALAALLSTSANGQTLTQVSATITDPNGLPYSNANVIIQLVGGGSTPQTTPCAVSPCNVQNPPAFQTNAAGQFSTALYANASITPGGTTWQFNVLEPGVAPPWGLGPKSLSVSLTISGATDNISSSLSAAAPALTPAFSGGATPCTTATGAVQYNITGAFSCNANFVYTPALNLLQNSAVGVFTNTQQNESNEFIVGTGCSPSSIFSHVFGGNFGTDGLSGTACLPSGSGVTNTFSSGIAGYAQGNPGITSSCVLTNCEVVGVSGIAYSDGQVFTWGGNFIAQGLAGTPTSLFGVESDVVPQNGGDTAIAFFASNQGGETPTNSQALFVNGPSAQSALAFENGVNCSNGSTVNACLLVGRSSQNGEVNSQNIILLSFTGSVQNSADVALSAGNVLELGTPAIDVVNSASEAEAEGLGIGLTSTNNLNVNELVKLDPSNPNAIVACTTTDTICYGFISDSLGAGWNCAAGGPFCEVITVPGSKAVGILGSGTCSIGQFVLPDTTTNGDVRCASSASGPVVGIAMSAQSTVGSTLTLLTEFTLK